MNCKTVLLKDLVLGEKGSYGIGAPAVDYDPKKYTYLRITDINDDGSINTNGLKSVDAEDAYKYVLQENDIVFARTGASTGKTYFYQPQDGTLVYAGFLIKFSIDPRKVNPRLLKYITHSQEYYNWVRSFDTGGTRGNINAVTFANMPITLPNRATQDKIVAILSSLDDKIELNRRINANLEQQAQALFDEYFIHNIGKLGNYSTASLTEIAQFLNGLAMQKFRPKGNEDGIPVLKIKELGQGKCDASSDLCSSSIPEEFIINNGDIVFSWSGTLLVDIWCSGICGLNQHLFKVSPLNYPKWLIYFWTKYHLSNFIRIAQDKAVTMGHIKRGDLDAAKVIIPSAESLKELDKIMSPMLQSIISNRIENNNLSILRDTLLPKLMSGEITV